MKISPLFSILILSVSLAANAVAGPRYIYHISSVMPIEAFDRGFMMTGQDIDLLRCMSGHSILDCSASFISATDSLAVALHISKQAVLKHREVPFWVYVIRPTEVVYDVMKSLRSAEGTLKNPDARRQARELILAFDWQKPWAAHGHISSSQIVGVYPVIVLFREEPYLGCMFPNEDYIEGASFVSDNVIPARDTPPDDVFIGEESAPGYPTSLSFNQDCEYHKLIPPRKWRCGTATHRTIHNLVDYSMAGLIATSIL